jgi:hypothetical protein
MEVHRGPVKFMEDGVGADGFARNDAGARKLEVLRDLFGRWPTEAPNMSAAFETIAGPRATIRPVLSASVARRLRSDAVAVLALSSPAAAGNPAVLQVMFVTDFAKVGPHRVRTAATLGNYGSQYLSIGPLAAWHAGVERPRTKSSAGSTRCRAISPATTCCTFTKLPPCWEAWQDCTTEPPPARSRGCCPSMNARWPTWSGAGQTNVTIVHCPPPRRQRHGRGGRPEAQTPPPQDEPHRRRSLHGRWRAWMNLRVRSAILGYQPPLRSATRRERGWWREDS